MNFPWARGDGVCIKTISLPSILQPIIKELSNESKLSSTIAELLWIRFGSTDMLAEEEELNILLKEKKAIEERIKQQENDTLSRRENNIRVERLKELKNDINKYRRIRNHMKNNPNGGWQYNRGYGLQRVEIEIAKSMVENYGSEIAFIQEFDSWIEEQEKLTLEIGQKARRKN